MKSGTQDKKVNMSILRKILVAVLFGCLSLAVVSCDKKGPAEKVGENIDKGIEKTGDAIKKTGDTIKEAGEAVEEAAEEVNEKIDDAKQ